MTKKPRVTEIESTDSESDTPQIKGRNGVNKRQKVSGQTKSSTKKNSSSGSSIVPAGQYMVSLLIWIPYWCNNYSLALKPDNFYASITHSVINCVVKIIFLLVT